MPALLLFAFVIYIIISFAIGFVIAYPMYGAIAIGSFAIIAAVYDYKRGAL